jgi:AcrR family transcriptional regulator
VKKQTVEERRTEILEVTCEVVIERGFAGTRIADVAKRLGVSSSLIHYHFDSKEQLLAEAFAHYARKDVAEMVAEVEAGPTFLAQLDRAIQNSVPEGSDDVEWMLWIDGWGEALRNPMMKKISQELDEQSAELLERIITSGVETGEFECADPRAAAMRLTALVDGLAIQFAAHDGMMDRHQLIDHVRAAAASEVGLTPAAFEQTVDDAPADVFSEPGAATDVALRHLVSRSCDAVIRADAEAWAATWAADAEWEPEPGRVLRGRDEIVRAWQAARAESAWVVQTPAVTVFEVNESTGVGHGRVTVDERFARTGGATGSILATYEDRYERIGGHWLVASRRHHAIATT